MEVQVEELGFSAPTRGQQRLSHCIFVFKLIKISISLLEFECYLDLQEDSSNNVCSKWRMNIQIEQNKPHRKHTSIAQEFTVSFTIIKSGVTIVYIGNEFECMTCNLNLSTGSNCS